MLNINEIKQHIRSVQQTRQITKAMYMISSVKMKKAMDSYSRSFYYLEQVRATMADILSHMGRVRHPFVTPRPGNRTAFLVVAGDKGLAGSYNENVMRLAMEQISQTPEYYVFTVGHMATRYFAVRGVMVDVEFLHTAQNPHLYNARQIAEEFISLYERELIDRMCIIYTHMPESHVQQPRVLKLLPLSAEDFADVPVREGFAGTFEYDPDPGTVFDSLVTQYLVGTIYSTLVLSYACEQRSRMHAMDSATQNADAMIEGLQRDFRRARQAAVTQEMTEVLGGTSAVMERDEPPAVIGDENPWQDQP